MQSSVVKKDYTQVPTSEQQSNDIEQGARSASFEVEPATQVEKSFCAPECYACMRSSSKIMLGSGLVILSGMGLGGAFGGIVGMLDGGSWSDTLDTMKNAAVATGKLELFVIGVVALTAVPIVGCVAGCTIAGIGSEEFSEDMRKAEQSRSGS